MKYRLRAQATAPHWGYALLARLAMGQAGHGSLFPLAKSRSQSYQDLAQIQAFEQFFWQHEYQIFGYLWRMVADEQEALDISQETFLRAWQHFAQLSTYDNPGGWLFQVASHLALSHLRQRARRRVQPLRNHDITDQPDIGHTVTQQLVIQDILHALPPKQRATLILHEVYGISCKEIAQMLGLSSETAKKTLQRARVAFRTQYAKEGDA